MAFDDRKGWFRLLLFTAFLIRVGAAFWWQQQADERHEVFRFGDSESYWVLAGKIAKGESYDYAGSDSRIFRAPLYPIFLAPFTWLEKRQGVMAARLAGAMLGTLSVALIVFATRRMAGSSAGLAAGVLAALYPGAIGMSVFVLSEALFCPLVIASLLLWVTAVEKIDGPPSSLDDRYFVKSKAPRLALASGALSGLACLTRPSWFLWPAMLGLFCLKTGLCRRWSPSASLSSDDSPERSTVPYLKALLAFGIGMIVTMSPWWGRNYVVTGRFVPTTLQVGASLYDGLHPGASGGSDEGMAFVKPFETALREEMKDSKQNSNDVFEWRLNRRLFEAAVAWAGENRSDACRLALVKFGKMWTPWPTAKEVGGLSVRIAESTAYIAILACATIGWWVAPQRRSTMGLYVLPTVYFAALHLVFASSVRYRQPAVLVLCVVAGIGAAWMLDRISKTSTRSKNGKP